MTPKILSLPHDLLFAVISYLPTAACLARLSATCKALHYFVAQEGWRVFVMVHYPYFRAKVLRELPGDKTAQHWRMWAEELTVTGVNWERFGFLASGMFVDGKWRSRRKKREEEDRLKLRLGAKEDACRPVIDLYEDWSTGEEVLAIGAGVNLMARRRRRLGREDWWWRYDGEEAGEETTDDEDAEKSTVLELLSVNNRHLLRGRRDDPHDYTALHLLGPHGDGELAVVGRASGSLEMVSLGMHPERAGKATVLKLYETPCSKSHWAPRVGKYTSVLRHPGPENQYGLMSAAVGRSSTAKVALYQLHVPPDDDISTTLGYPVSEILSDSPGREFWSTNLLSSSHLAVTKTNCLAPLSVYSIAPDGIRQTPLRSFSSPDSYDNFGTDCNATARLQNHLSDTPSGSVFLGAWSSGTLRCIPSS
jgi:F-box-like